MLKERKGVITFAGTPMTLFGGELTVGSKAPDFSLQATDLSIKTMADYAGKVLIISVVPSLDTGVCDAQTKRFSQEVEKLGDNAVILTVSCDLPFAQLRWCGTQGVNNVVTLSDHLNLNFGLAYGVAIKELRLLTRAAFVVGKDGTIVYSQIVPEVTTPINFDEVLAAASRVLV